MSASMWVMDDNATAYSNIFHNFFFFLFSLSPLNVHTFCHRVAFISDNDGAQGFHHSQWLVSRQQPVYGYFVTHLCWYSVNAILFTPFVELNFNHFQIYELSQACIFNDVFAVHACVNPFAISRFINANRLVSFHSFNKMLLASEEMPAT